MSMFLYFPTNYVWSLAVNAALESGGRIGEIDEACAPLQTIARDGADAGTEALMNAWLSMAEKLFVLAEENEAQGRLLSAGEQLQRAAVYLQSGERMLAHGSARRESVYRRMLDAFNRAQLLMRANCERVEIPYGDAHLAGLLVRAEGPSGRLSGPQPIVLVVNGLDSTKELIYTTGFTRQLAQRGVGLLFLDQPGTGEALRLHAMPAVHDSEAWASRVVDWLEQHGGVDPRRIGMMGVSLGGYYTPRAVAFEPRFACGAVWGANHDWGEMQRRRLNREGENPVPHYWEHVRWVFGARDMEDFMAKAERMNLNGVLDHVTVPFLVTHGESDRQIPVAYAQQTFDQLVNSPRRELKVFTAREGGVHHVSLDNMVNAGAFIADWLAESLGGRVC